MLQLASTVKSPLHVRTFRRIIERSSLSSAALYDVQYTNTHKATYSKQHHADEIRTNVAPGLLLLRHTDGTSATTGGLRVLTTDTESPVVAHTTVSMDTLQSFQIFTQLRVDVGRRQLHVLAIDDILLSVQEPVRDLVVTGVRDDGDDLLNLLVGALTGALERIDIGLLQHNMGITPANTLDGGQRNRNGALTIDVGAQHTENVLELLWNYERLKEETSPSLVRGLVGSGRIFTTLRRFCQQAYDERC